MKFKYKKIKTMKKLILIIFAFSFLQITGISQNENSTIDVKIGGFIQYSMYMDTYESVDTRDGAMSLYPKRASLDSNNNDVNKNLQFQMVSVQTRPKISVTGPEVARAKYGL